MSDPPHTDTLYATLLGCFLGSLCWVPLTYYIAQRPHAPTKKVDVELARPPVRPIPPQNGLTKRNTLTPDQRHILEAQRALAQKKSQPL